MAIIDPEGLFSGERLAACSDMAQLCWPRFFLAANSCGRIELSYKSLVSRVFGNFLNPPKSDELWAIFREYENNFLAVLYESESGVWWCQFITSVKFLPKYQKTRDKESPAPSFEMMEAHRRGYLEWKRSKSFKNQSFRKFPELFSREGIGIGVGVGEGEGIGVGEKQTPVLAKPDREKEVVERAFGFYCESLQKNPKKYQLTDQRRQKASLRFRERLKANGGDSDAVEQEFAKCIENLAASDYHVSNGYTDWVEQIFRSQEEFEKRLNWTQKTNGGGGNNATVLNGTGERIMGVLKETLSRRQRDRSAGEDGDLPAGGQGGRLDARPVHTSPHQPRLASVSGGDEESFKF